MFNQIALLSWALGCQELKVKLIHSNGKVAKATEFKISVSIVRPVQAFSVLSVSNTSSATCKINAKVCYKQFSR